MEINGKSKKEIKETFRKLVAGGKPADRATLLAYAFVRGVPYAVLESKINEDHPNFGASGRNCFLDMLSYRVVNSIFYSSFDKSEYTYSDMKETRIEIFNWMLKKYEKSIKKTVPAVIDVVHV